MGGNQPIQIRAEITNPMNGPTFWFESQGAELSARRKPLPGIARKIAKRGPLARTAGHGQFLLTAPPATSPASRRISIWSSDLNHCSIRYRKVSLSDQQYLRKPGDVRRPMGFHRSGRRQQLRPDHGQGIFPPDDGGQPARTATGGQGRALGAGFAQRPAEQYPSNLARSEAGRHGRSGDGHHLPRRKETT